MPKSRMYTWNTVVRGGSSTGQTHDSLLICQTTGVIGRCSSNIEGIQFEMELIATIERTG
uniref:Uncharacterized protein n=1 Tax=Pristionchus pacificus TaxID=54126 RepID=A0A2A6BAJ9_PRIPA|eukprot:PDM62915.1 hypothetical protein PRIPAC_50130 [Pristionchus pacificus]